MAKSTRTRMYRCVSAAGPALARELILVDAPIAHSSHMHMAHHVAALALLIWARYVIAHGSKPAVMNQEPPNGLSGATALHKKLQIPGHDVAMTKLCAPASVMCTRTQLLVDRCLLCKRTTPLRRLYALENIQTSCRTL